LNGRKTDPTPVKSAKTVGTKSETTKKSMPLVTRKEKSVIGKTQTKLVGSGRSISMVFAKKTLVTKSAGFAALRTDSA